MKESSAPTGTIGSRTLIVDSWPVLEWLYRNEPGHLKLREHLEAAERGELQLIICRLNCGEVFYNYESKRRRGEVPSISLDLASLPWQIVSVDDELVDRAAELKSIYPVSYADCFVAAPAQRYQAAVLSGDPDFLRLQEAGVLIVEWMGA